MAKPVRIAVEGCGHGTLDAIYAAVDEECRERGWDGVDLLIINGDFQAVRNALDLNTMSVPMKYRAIGDFHKYYSGAAKAPYLTIFIGGNHEASNYLFELFYGGWVAPNIYYLGAANVLRFGPLRIAGMSGIWKGVDYRKPHYERLPYCGSDIKSIYHVREYDVRKLLQIRSQVDIGLSHDWPRGVEWLGDWQRLLRFKPHFERDARDGTLGSTAARKVLDRLRPYHWLSGHMHCKYEATVSFDVPDQVKSDQPANTPAAGPAKKTVNEDEIDLDLDEDDVETAAPQGTQEAADAGSEQTGVSEQEIVPSKREVSGELLAQLPDSFKKAKKEEPKDDLPFPEDITNKTTKFLALDKCLPKRNFLELMEIAGNSGGTDSAKNEPFSLFYDREWLAITRVFASELVVGDANAVPNPEKLESHYRARIEEEERWVEENVVQKNCMKVPENFETTAPFYNPEKGIAVKGHPVEYTNNQTSRYCQMIEIPNPFDISDEERRSRKPPHFQSSQHGRGSGFHGGRGGGRGRGRGGGGGRGGRGGRWN